MTRIVTYVEVDLPYCAHIYGTAPCAAALGVTGDHKCFQTLKSCQDRDNFLDEPVTLRFAKANSYLPDDIEAIESLTDVSLTPSRISLGENLGERASVVATFKDHRWPDTAAGFDKYAAERDYDPAKQGTFWGRFRARHPYVRGRDMRVIRGEVGQTLAEMETRHYKIEAFDGPDASGRFTISAHDVLKLAGNDRAQAPFPNTGFLVAAINSAVTAATLSPAGIGNEEYAASGWLNLGNKEIVSFTRSGNALTIVRGQLGTLAVAHDENELVQTVLRYSGEDPADIISDLLQTYAGVPSSAIPIEAWQTETAAYLGRVYTATIPVPTGVEQLVSNLVEQAALAIWTDEIEQEVRLRVLRAITPDAATFSPENYVAGSLTIQEQPDKRVSQVQIFYGQINPLVAATEVTNYAYRHIDYNPQSEADYGSPAIRTIFAYWIPAFGNTTAERLATLLLGAYVDPPRHFAWSVMKYGADDMDQGGVYFIENPFLQDETGAGAMVPSLVTRVNSGEAFLSVEAEENLWQTFDPEDVQNRQIIIDANAYNVDALAVHDTLFPELTDTDVSNGVTLTITIQPGVTVGSLSTSLYAFTVPTGWPTGFVPKVVNLGRIQGMGGDGGDAGGGANLTGNGHPGSDGGPALRVQTDIELTNDDGEIFGGGGGGGGGGSITASSFPAANRARGIGGGGGAGSAPGTKGISYTGFGTADAMNGTADAGGDGGGGPAVAGSDGGDPGLAGETGSGGHADWTNGAGGDAGKAIQGDSHITFTGADGDIRGARTG